MKHEAPRETERLLKVLVQAPCPVRPAASEGRVLVERADGAPVAISRATIDAAVRAGLVGRDGDQLALTGDGRMAMRRTEAVADSHAAQHRETIDVVLRHETGLETATINLAESPLALIARRKDRNGRPFLSPGELAAGERLRADFTRAGMSPRLGINWDMPIGGRRGGPGSAAAEMGDGALDAKRRIARAVTEVGPELSGVLLDVCCFLKGLKEVERERSWPVRSAKLMLKTALAALARHYEPQTRRGSGIRHWGADGFRPKI